jgi:hypothetical protein
MFSLAQDATSAVTITTVAAAITAATATESSLMSKKNELTVGINYSLVSHLLFCSACFMMSFIT